MILSLYPRSLLSSLGYTGHDCATPFSNCDDNPCMNGASCTDLPDYTGYVCTCPPYYTGDNCDITVTPCDYNPCWNSGACVPNYTQVSLGVYNYSTGCNCTDAFMGDICDIDVNECVISTPCFNEGTCINTNGGYLCLCTDGYTGDDCNAEINECNDNPCYNSGVCTDEFNGYTCNCTGTLYTGPTCNIPRNMTCEVHGCQYGGECEYSNISKKHVCTCEAGYIGEFCSYVYKPCPNGSCDSAGTLECIQNSTDDIVCVCKPDYSGPSCVINVWNSCEHNECYNNGTCADDNNGTFRCTCLDGFYGRNCEVGIRQGECEGGLGCMNDGECIRVVDDEFCKCSDGWGGPDCSFDIDECYQTPCQNGGICKNLEGSYECNCTAEFKGFNCETIGSDCNTIICENGGFCMSDDGDELVCSCPQGYEGQLCEKEGMLV